MPQGSVLGPLLNILYTSDIPATPNTQMGTFADDTVLLWIHRLPRIDYNYTDVYKRQQPGSVERVLGPSGPG